MRGLNKLCRQMLYKYFIQIVKFGHLLARGYLYLLLGGNSAIFYILWVDLCEIEFKFLIWR